MPSRNVIDIHKLSFSFAKDPVLQDICLNFAKGKFYTILGPNGSGKTTLLKTIAKLYEIKQGEISVNGVSLETLTPKNLAQQLAVMPQDTAIEFEFSVLDVVMMGRNPYLSRFVEESEADLNLARQAMEITNTWHLRDRSITQLSGGERQRVMIARALTQQTGIIALDEPVSHLDIHHQIALLKQISEMNRVHEVTVLAVLHDLNLAAAFSDYLVLMHQGRIHCHGVPEEVLKPDIIEAVYGVAVHIIQAPDTGRPYVIPKI
ncbi:MAG TPA: heme ABC transporter ATP-binding protein [Bacillota bacterium]|nr:heme ABC transporter ATP-binding protein [Bacillota bacterium]